MKNQWKKTILIILATLFLITNTVPAINIESSDNIDNIDNNSYNRIIIAHQNENEDIDPLVDLEVTVAIKEIRALDEIDKYTQPDFFVRVYINDELGESKVWKNQKHLYDPDYLWTFTKNVPDDEEFVDIRIELWDWNFGLNQLCDIAYNDNDDPNRQELNLQYNLKTGHWRGDDYIYPSPEWFDRSGYGRANGCDDNSIYQMDYDCEIWFDIFQNDFDGDTVPYWTEINIFDTDPTIDDTGRDDDDDDVPLEWEHKWGHYSWYNWHNDQWYYEWFYHPFIYEDHYNIDTDGDSINNVEEYLTSKWGSDPFRKDIFVELDQMDGNGNIPPSMLPEESKELIKLAFNRQNIVFHLDDGSWEEGSESEIIPFDSQGKNTTRQELEMIYNQYFLHGNNNNWRKGVFHYGVVIYNAEWIHGFAFGSNKFQISQKGVEEKNRLPLTGNRDVVYATAYMHELGHTLALNHLGGHDQSAKKWWQINWWKWRNYKSIMNYGYMYGFLHNLVDYSDGSHGKNDYDDWSNINYDYFEKYA